MVAHFTVLVPLVLAVAALTALLVWQLIGYARRRGLVDLPGQRRLHRMPTPRGGGVGIVVALVAGLIAMQLAYSALLPWRWLSCWLSAILLTALVGAIDDHRSLGILPRIGAHLGAGLLLLLALWPELHLPGERVIQLLLAAALVLATAWSINLHNFMDGSDGLLSLQVLVVALGFAVMAGRAAHTELAGAALLLAATQAGFLPFNLPWPRARIFMGDAGSGTLGFMIAALALSGMAVGAWSLPAALLLVSAFVADASATLLARLLRGRRWWHPHREHLYQWLARSSGSHRQPLLAYLAWNLLLALPLAFVAQGSARLGWWLVAGLYMLAGGVWWQGKRACRDAMRHRPDLRGNRHAPA